MSLQTVLFWVLALLTGFSAIAVVLTQNIVRAALWLLFALGGTSGVFFLLGADFVGATQLFVYVGGTLVLVVFGVMLTAQGPFISMKVGAAEWAIAAVVGLLLFGVLALSITGWPWGMQAALKKDVAHSMSSDQLGAALVGMPQATPEANLTNVSSRRPQPRTRIGYLLPFEIVSVHLLVVLIGAAYLARAKRRRGATV